MAHGNAHRNHAAKLGVHRVRVSGRYQSFTFSEAFGPLLTDEWGEPTDNAGLAWEANPFWDAFEAWIKTQSPATQQDQPHPESRHD